MKVLSAAEMQTCDRVTSERFGVPSIELMRHAAEAVAGVVQEVYPRARRITVLCGRGNNGGDGMMAARRLADARLAVSVLLLGDPQGLKGDAVVAWRELKTSGNCTIRVTATAEELNEFADERGADLIIDAVLGTGFKPPMKGLALAALEWVKTSSAPVLAVDLPSGWPADEMAMHTEGPVFPADAVVTFTVPKPAHVFGQLTRAWDQPIVVAGIGSPDGAVVSELKLKWAGAAQALTSTKRSADANKGRFGHVLVVGGSLGRAGGKTGAPAMAALAALRTGAGLVTAAVPEPALKLVASISPELMTWPLAATAAGQVAAKNAAPKNVNAITAGKTVLAVGPGMGQSAETARFLAGLLAATEMPVVIDADALNLLAAEPKLMKKLSKSAKAGRTVVLTPHPGEMARLAKTTTAKVQANRLELARSFAKTHAVTLVLKGWRTLVAHPDGQVAVNTTGNPGMAKGGSGDLLTGMVSGILAQFPDEPASAVEAAVYLHGLAADIAVRDADEHTLLATDCLCSLPSAFRFQAFHFREGSRSGYVWLQGLPKTAARAKVSHEEEE
ncbi:MAG TPA: NAD(P)H-hydrate dehydratase [Terracidiphilus sp.]|nr:NAD(P)H-hydrate dehydratase [Terracidiphilus sp.]